MAKKFILLLHDDWELMGNGLGNVASIQYLPALFLTSVAKELGIRLTFMVDVAQQLAFMKYQHLDRNIEIQKKLWDDSVRYIKDNGFDVQLHLHPQWHDAEYRGNFFYLNQKWNIATYSDNIRWELLKKSIEYLQNLLGPLDKDYRVHSFKAGAWGLQPSENLFQDLIKLGIRIVLGVRRDMKKKKLNIDYEGLEEDTLPYYPDIKDIRKVAKNAGQIIIIPLAYYYPGLWSVTRLTVHNLKNSLLCKNLVTSLNNYKIPREIKAMKPVERDRIKISIRPFISHLKIGNQPFTYLKKSFDTVIKRYQQTDLDTVPIVIESHTKEYVINYSSIRKFLYYIVDKYGDIIEFTDLSTFLKELDKTDHFVKK